MREIIKYTLVVVLALGALGKIALIDKPRTRYTKVDAILAILFNGLFIWAILTWL